MTTRSTSYSNTVECTVTVPTPSARYFDELCSLTCAGDLVRFFPNAKEITESFTCFNAVRKMLGSASFGENLTCLIPGDGTAPRTGALFALRTRWHVISVDPLMKPRWVLGRHNIQRLSVKKAQVESMVPLVAPRVVVVSCHSHASLLAAVRRVSAERIDVISLPCCVADDIGRPTKTWRDKACWSPQNTINAYMDWRP